MDEKQLVEFRRLVRESYTIQRLQPKLPRRHGNTTVALFLADYLASLGYTVQVISRGRKDTRYLQKLRYQYKLKRNVRIVEVHSPSQVSDFCICHDSFTGFGANL